MESGDPRSWSWRRGVALTLALMALVMRVMIPAGFMMAQAPSGAFAMVICSADGGRTVDAGWADASGKQKPPEKHDSPCVFAGHGLASAPPVVLVATPVERVAPAVEPSRPSRTLTPGRGLAAPPPPSTGPPVLSI